MLPDVEVFAGHVVDTIKAALDPVLDRVATLEKREPVNGRDGLPGLPGVPGRDGAPGRDADDGLLAEFKADFPVFKDLLLAAEGRIANLERQNKELSGVIERMAVLETRMSSVKDGAPGAPGEKGEKGDKGDPGEAGQRGTDGIHGQKGDPGECGERGTDGAPGAAGARGEKGDAGLQGLPGDRGLTGEKGLDGAPGRDGRDGLPGVQGEKGLDGQHGTNGRDGKDGLDGFGFEDLEVDEDVVNRKAILRFRKGDRVKEFPIIFHGMQLYRGVWEPTKTYDPGDTVTWNGAQWVAKVQTSAKPGAEDIERTWQMCVSRGKEGKQGPDGKPGLPGPRGEKGIDGRKWGVE